MNENFFHSSTAYESDFTPGRSTVQPDGARWHGDPMVTLQRGFLLNGWAPSTFPRDVSTALFTPVQLYGDNDRPPSVQGSIRKPEARHANEDSDSSDDDDPPPGLRTLVLPNIYTATALID